ncbi:MAG: type II secretion system F family protein [Patescibacteria group bacterium]
MEKAKNLITNDTETFKVDEQKSQKEKIVLNIQEEAPKGIVLNRYGEKIKFEEGGIFGWYYKINNYFVEHSGVKTKDKADFFHLLAVMINSGIPMVKSLKSLALQLEKSPRMHMIVSQLAESIEEGESLSVSMLAFDDIFGEAEVGMVESGEASGQLAKVLNNLATDAEKAASIKSKVKSAMMYPIVILTLLVGVVVAMMVLVIPKLKELFASMKGELPLITRIVVGTSEFLQARGLFLLVGILLLILLLMYFRKTEVGKYYLDNFKLHIPIFGELFQKSFLARFARSLSNLLDSDVTIVRTMEITANSIGNEVYRKRLLMAMEDLKQGIPLAESLTENPLFPPMLVNMIDVGEKTAQLDTITAKIAAFYEEEVDTAVNGISKVIEPVILIIIGATVGVVVASIMLPIMKLTSLSGAM